MADAQQDLNKSAQSTAKHALVQILGKVKTAIEVRGRPAENSTRWVFDIESDYLSAKQDIFSGLAEEISFRLLDPRNEKLLFKPDIFSCSLTPLCAEFYSAQPYIEYRESEGSFVIHARNVGGLVRYRVGIDTIHSATR